MGRGRGRNDLARFLLTRGLWLIFLEFAVVRFGWTFNLDLRLNFAVVLWALGWSMIFLAALVYHQSYSLLLLRLSQPVVFPHHLSEPVMRDRINFIPADTSH